MYKVSYTGDGFSTEFAFKFPFFQETDVCVAVNGEIIGSAFYNINPDQNMDGGMLTFATAPADGATVDIFRKIHLERFVDYQPTAKLDVERLNDDFNFLLEAFRDFNTVDIDIAEWQNTFDNVLYEIKYTKELIEDKLSGGKVLGIFNNLISVLANALPMLINDYGSITDSAPNENNDDYGAISGNGQ